MLTPHARHLPVVRPGRALINPRSQQADLFHRESLAFRRHGLVRLQAGDEMHEPAAATVAWQDDLAIITALERGQLHVETQPALLFFRPVALQTVIGEQRLDVAGVVCGRGGCWRQL